MKGLMRSGAAAALLLAATGAPAEAKSSGLHKPNFIIILADDLGKDAFAPNTPFTDDIDYPEAAPVPSLAKLAKQGVLFENGWAMTQCTATRGARSMGLYPSTSGMGSVIGGGTARIGGPGPYEGVLFPPTMINPADGKQIQQIMRKAGYKTYKLGKWHETAFTGGLTQVPIDTLDDVTAAGFDEFVGFAQGFPPGGYGGTAETNINNVEVDQTYRLVSSRHEGGEVATAEFLTSFLVGQAVEMIEEAKAEGEPYYMAFDFAAPHWIFAPPPTEGWEVPPGPGEPAPEGVSDWRTLSYEDHGSVITQVADAWGGEYPAAGTESGAGVAPEDVARKRAAFKALVSYMDVQIGRLLEHVDLSNTYVMFIGDNGTSGVGFAGPAFDVIEQPFLGTKSKGTLYRNGVEVPFLVAGGNTKRQRKPNKALVNVTDVLATVTDLARVKQPKQTRGQSISFKPALYGWGGVRRYQVAERFSNQPSVGGPAGAPSGNDGRVVADQRFRLLVRPLLDEDGLYVCNKRYAGNSNPEWGELVERECLTEKGVYAKQHYLEFYDTKSDALELDALVKEEMTKRQWIAFKRLCLEVNKISKRAAFYQNGKVCKMNGSQLIDIDPVPAEPEEPVLALAD